MTAREAYFKAYIHSDKPMGMLFYTFKQGDIERIGSTQWMQFVKADHEYNVGMLEDIEMNINGFMFWNISDEADEFLKQKSQKYKQVFNSLAFLQK